MKIFVVTTEMKETLIHNISVEEGKYLRPKKVTGGFSERAEVILMHMLTERPDKIVFETVAYGMGVYDSFLAKMKTYGFSMAQDGLIKYN